MFPEAINALQITVLLDLHWILLYLSTNKQGQPISPSQFLLDEDKGPMLNALNAKDSLDNKTALVHIVAIVNWTTRIKS